MNSRTSAILRRLADSDAVTDAELLKRFTATRDEVAFELLVWRHSGMVHRVCIGVLRDHQAAEDACQATFLALARQANVVGRGEVAGWLFRVARRLAMRVAVRERRHPTESPDALSELLAPSSPLEPDPALVHVLHEEVAGLPERYRVPVILCFFEGLTHRAAAERLKVPVGTLAANIARAKVRLRHRLAARGFGTSAVVLVAALSCGSATAMPAFIAATTRAAVRYSTGLDSGVSETILELAKGATCTMSKSQWAMGMIVACLVMTLSGLWVAGRADPLKPPVAENSDAPAAVHGFNNLPVDANDLVDAHTLNIYKFKVEIPKNQQFHVVLRELDNKDAKPRELSRFSFQRTEKEGPITMRVSFTRKDGVVGSILLTDQKDAIYSVTCLDCEPTSMIAIVPVPLSGLKVTEKMLVVHQSDKENRLKGVKETCLLSVFKNVKGESNYPRVELVIEKD